ncbi:hypothetical protein EUTSA_v10001089mg [Eutrema salsugineum]|uniref:Uncharacterized protein n=1 Tax=Eutrema salsugineum TaxID=72664 RepID=V4LBH9_EUTSA|nr:hypothetical protein EUTSA_v10001089mg [Eutrema salsugineum]
MYSKYGFYKAMPGNSHKPKKKVTKRQVLNQESLILLCNTMYKIIESTRGRKITILFGALTEKLSTQHPSSTMVSSFGKFENCCCCFW